MAGGTLGRIELQQPESLEDGQRRFQIFGDALKAIAARGLSLPGPPKSGFMGDLPPDITSLDDDDLGDLLSNIAEYCGYVEGQLALADIERTSAEGHLEFVRARIRLGLKAQQSDTLSGNQKLTVKDKDDLVETDPRVVEAKARDLYTKAVYTLTKTILNRVQRNWDTVSRRITQRGQDVERLKRESNVVNTPTPSTAGRWARR